MHPKSEYCMLGVDEFKPMFKLVLSFRSGMIHSFVIQPQDDVVGCVCGIQIHLHMHLGWRGPNAETEVPKTRKVIRWTPSGFGPAGCGAWPRGSSSRWGSISSRCISWSRSSRGISSRRSSGGSNGGGGNCCYYVPSLPFSLVSSFFDFGFARKRKTF